MYAVVMLFLTVHPDFYLPFYDFDKKHCMAQVENIYSRTTDLRMVRVRYDLRQIRSVQQARMLKGLPPLDQPREKMTPASPSPFAPSFSVALLLLIVHPDFYLSNDKFDWEYCRTEYSTLLGTWGTYRNLGDSYDDAPSEQQREEVARHIESVCRRITQQTAELDEFRYYQRSRFLRGTPLHTHPKS